MSNISGFLNINKPAGMSSAKAVAKVKALLPAKTRIGHTGTLDPNVTGVLPLAIGKATKAIAFLDDERKTYQATMRLGIKTDSADIWGEILLKETPPVFSKLEVQSVLNSFLGENEQIPPMYSALKHKGKRLYQLARDGVVVERTARKITIFALELIAYDFPEITFKVECSRGTYVRTICEDIAEKLGTIAAMTALERLKTAVFDIENSYQLEEISSDNIIGRLLPANILFSDLAKIEVDYQHARHLYNGVKVNLARFYHGKRYDRYAVYHREHFIGVGESVGNDIFMAKLLGEYQNLLEIG